MIIHRGIACISCTNLDLQQYADAAKLGWGRCTADPPVMFARIEMVRNCDKYEPAPAEQVAKRQAWADKIPLPAWQR